MLEDFIFLETAAQTAQVNLYDQTVKKETNATNFQK